MRGPDHSGVPGRRVMIRRRPLFLDKTHYKRSRAIDAARILPIAGFVLLLLPILWTGNDSIGIMQAALFLFGLWALMIVAALLLSRFLRDPAPDPVSGPAPAAPTDPAPGHPPQPHQPQAGQPRAPGGDAP